MPSLRPHSGDARAAAVKAPDRVRLLETPAIPHPRSIKPTPTLLWRARHFATLRQKNAAERIQRVTSDSSASSSLWIGLFPGVHNEGATR
jgi:hypothetical protein